MAMDRKIYDRVVEAYRSLGSVGEVVKSVGLSEVKVRRILITEGLWSSRTSRQIASLLEEGLATQEIADRMQTSVKAIEAYLPSRRGVYDEEDRSIAAIRSEEYRRRNEAALQKQVSHAKDGSHSMISRMQSGRQDQGNHTDLKESHQAPTMEKPPSVMQLHLKLTGTESVDHSILRTYGKAKHGISRDILVPMNITLHALHYCIQRAFGWQNSHLHHFEYPQEVQDMLLNAIGGGGNCATVLSKLCGIYFRFPVSNERLYYWDDDYDGTQSIKTWLRRKYTGPYTYEWCSEHCMECRGAVYKARGRNQESFETGATALLERICLGDLIFPEHSEIISDWARKVLDISEKAERDFVRNMDSYTQIQHRLMQASDLYSNDGAKSIEAYDHAFREYKAFVSKFDSKTIPLSDTLIYRYDYGEGWEIQITCKEFYYTKDLWDRSGGGFVISPLTAKRFLEETDAYDHNNNPVESPLCDQIAQVVVYHRPVCIGADGLNVMDDVGGIAGFSNFLATIYEGTADEMEERKRWGRTQGWSGRMQKPATIL